MNFNTLSLMDNKLGNEKLIKSNSKNCLNKDLIPTRPWHMLVYI